MTLRIRAKRCNTWALVVCVLAVSVAAREGVTAPQQQQLPAWTHACRVVIRGSSPDYTSSWELVEASLECWAAQQVDAGAVTATAATPPLQVAVGRRLLPYLNLQQQQQQGPQLNASSTDSDTAAGSTITGSSGAGGGYVVVSVRSSAPPPPPPATPPPPPSPPSPPPHPSGDAEPPAAGHAFSGPTIPNPDLSDDWGITFLGPMGGTLRIVDSILTNVPLSPVGPLLYCANCSYVSLENVTFSRLLGYSLPADQPFDMAWQMYVVRLARAPYPVYGAFAATGLRGAEVVGSRCANVRRGHGWSCLLLQYEGAPDSGIVPSSAAVPSAADAAEGNSSDSSSGGSNGGRSASLIAAAAAAPYMLLLTDTTIFNNSISAGGVPGTEVGFGAVVIAGPGAGPLVALDEATAAWAAAAEPDGPVAAYAAAASVAAAALSAAFNAQDSDSTGVLEAKRLVAMGAVMRNSTVHVVARGCVLSHNMGAHGAALAAVLGANLGNVSLLEDCEVASNTAYLSGGWLFATGSVGALSIGPNVTVTANSASTAGGAVYVQGNITGAFRVGGGSRVTGNSVLRYGGFLTVNGSMGSLELAEASAVDYNTAGRTYDDGSYIGGKGGVGYVRGGIGAVLLAGGSSMSYNVVSPGTDWSSGGGGGALAVQGPVGTLALLDGSSMVNNSASNAGGAIYIWSGLDRLLVSGGSRLSDNACVDDSGGAVAVEGPLRSAVLEGGSAMNGNSGWQGGALWVGGPMQELVVRGRSSMSGNRAATTSGGAALVSGDIVAVRVEGGSRVCGNRAGTAGGALRARRIQTLSVTDSELSGNTALGTVAPAVVGWSFSGSGGAVYASGGVHDLSLLRSNVSHNRGVSGAGGFLFQGAENAVETGAASLPAGSIDPSPGVHWLESSAVVGNEAGLGGGAMWYSRLPLQVVVTGGSRLEGNVAHGGSGGALWAGWEPGAMSQPRPTELSSDTPLCRQGARITVNGSSTLTANRATMDGAAICVSLDIFAAYGNCTKTGNSSLTLELYGGAAFDSNSAAGGGGAIFVLQPYNFQAARMDVRINASGVRFANNSAGADAIGLLRGSGLGLGDGSSSLASSAVGGSRRVSAFGGHGGAVLVWSERRGTLVEAVAVPVSSTGSSSTGSSNTSSHAAGGGGDRGGGSSGAGVGPAALAEAIAAEFGGGSLAQQQPQPRAGGSCLVTMRGVELVGNQGTGGSGGALLLGACPTSISGSSLQGNSADVSGGAVALWDQTLESVARAGGSSSSSSSSSNSGGGSSLQQPQALLLPVLSLINCSFAGNTALGKDGGGALFVDVSSAGHSAVMSNCSLTGNRAVLGPGGAIAAVLRGVDLGPADSISSEGNSSGGSGGAGMQAAVAAVEVRGCAMLGNLAGGVGGGAMYARLYGGSGVWVTDSRMVGNAATSSAVGSSNSSGGGGSSSGGALLLDGRRLGGGSRSGSNGSSSDGWILARVQSCELSRNRGPDGGALAAFLDSDAPATAASAAPAASGATAPAAPAAAPTAWLLVRDSVLSENSAMGSEGAQPHQALQQALLTLPAAAATVAATAAAAAAASSSPDTAEGRHSYGGCGGAVLVQTRSAAATAALAELASTSPSAPSARVLGPPPAVFSMQNCRLMSNAAASWGGAVFVPPGSSATLLNSTFESNTAGASGGAVAGYACGSLVLSDCRVTGGGAVRAGGGLSAAACAAVRVERTELIRNNAAGGGTAAAAAAGAAGGGTGGTTEAAGLGGAVWLVGVAETQLLGCRIEGGGAQVAGGGVYATAVAAASVGAAPTTLVVADSGITNNTAAQGGGLHLGAGLRAVLLRSQVLGNAAVAPQTATAATAATSGSGSGSSSGSSSLAAADTAEAMSDSSPYAGYGGGMFVERGAAVLLSGCSFWRPNATAAVAAGGGASNGAAAGAAIATLQSRGGDIGGQVAVASRAQVLDGLVAALTAASAGMVAGGTVPSAAATAAGAAGPTPAPAWTTTPSTSLLTALGLGGAACLGGSTGGDAAAAAAASAWAAAGSSLVLLSTALPPASTQHNTSQVTALWAEDATLSAIYARCGNGMTTSAGSPSADPSAGSKPSSTSARAAALADLSGCVGWDTDGAAARAGGNGSGSGAGSGTESWEDQQQLQLDGAVRSGAAVLLPPSLLGLVQFCTVDERSGHQERCVVGGTGAAAVAAAGALYFTQQQQSPPTPAPTPALALLAAGVGLQQHLEMQPERPFTLAVQLYDDLGQPWTADWPPMRVGLAVLPVPPAPANASAPSQQSSAAHGGADSNGTLLTPAAQLAAACAAAAADATAAAAAAAGGGVNATGGARVAPPLPLWCEPKAVSLATLDGSSAVTAGTELLVEVRSGAASWPWLLVRGWPGRYVLTISTNGAYAVAPLALALTLRRCAAGQTLDTSEAAAAAALGLDLDLMAAPTWTACRSCDMFQVGLWSDDRPELSALDGPDQLAAVTAAAQDAGACLNCPAHAVCPSGPVLLPAPGYWHSSPNSPLVLRCPNSDACTYDDGNGLGDGGGGSGGSGSALSSSSTSAAAAGRRRLLQLGTATGSSNGSSNSIGAWDVAGAVARMGFNDSRSLRLALCQQLWYSTNPPGQAPELLQLLQPAALSTTPPQQPPLQPPALQQPPSSPSPSASSPAPQPQPQPLSQAQALQACVLWGLDPGSPLSYMSAQCAPGYAGHLCATCQPGFALSLDFQCSACPTTAQTVGLGLLAFAASVALVLYTAYTNSGEPSGDGDDKGGGSGNGGSAGGGSPPEIGDVIKVVVVHMQMLIIITRLPIDYPNAVLKFRGALNAVTGTASYVAFSPSCLAPDQSPAGQARAGLLGALAVPLLVAAFALGLWALRYQFFSQARMKRSSALPRWRLTPHASGGSTPNTATPRQQSRGADGTQPQGPQGQQQQGQQHGTGSGRQRTNSGGLLPFRLSLGRWWLGGGGGSTHTPFNFSFRTVQEGEGQDDDVHEQGQGQGQGAVADEECGKVYGSGGGAAHDGGGSGGGGDEEGLTGDRDTGRTGGADVGTTAAGRQQQHGQEQQLQQLLMGKEKLLRGGSGSGGGDGDGSPLRDEGPPGDVEQQGGGGRRGADSTTLLEAAAGAAAVQETRRRHRVSWAGSGNPTALLSSSQPHGTASLDAQSSGRTQHRTSFNGSGAAGGAQGSLPPLLPSTSSASVSDAFPTRPSPSMLLPAAPRSHSGHAGPAVEGHGGVPLRAHGVDSNGSGSGSGSGTSACANPILRSALRSASASREAATAVAPAMAAGAPPPVTPPAAAHSPASTAGSPPPRSSSCHAPSVASSATGGGSGNGSPSTRPLLPPTGGPGNAAASSGDAGSSQQQQKKMLKSSATGMLGADRSSGGRGAAGSGAGSPLHALADEAGGGVAGGGVGIMGPPGTQRSSWASGWSSHKSILRTAATSSSGIGQQQQAGSGTSSSNDPSSSGALKVPLAAASSPSASSAAHRNPTPAASRQQSYIRHGSRGSCASGASGGGGQAHRHSGKASGGGGGGGGGSGQSSGRYGDGRSSGGSQQRYSHGHLSGLSSRLLRSVSTAVRRLPAPLVKQLGSLHSVGSHLQHYDQALSLPRQLGVVLLAGVFVLYPGLVSASLSVFACRILDTPGAEYGGVYDSNLAATWRYGYWIRDMGQQCYSGTHAALYVPVGVVAVLLFCIGPPAASFVIVWRVRDRLNDHHTRRTYGFLYSRYRSTRWWWESVLQVETLSLVAVDVFARALTVTQQALLLLAALTLILTANMLASPLRHRLLVALEFVSLAALSLTITLSLYFTADTDTLSPAAATAVGVIILVINVGIISLFMAVILRRHQPQLSKTWAEWRQGLQAGAARCLGSRSCCGRQLLPIAWRSLALPGHQAHSQHAPQQQKVPSARLEGVDEEEDADEAGDGKEAGHVGHGGARGNSDSSSGGGPNELGCSLHGSSSGRGRGGFSRLLAAPHVPVDSPDLDLPVVDETGGEQDESDAEHERKLQALVELREEEEEGKRQEQRQEVGRGMGLEGQGGTSVTAAVPRGLTWGRWLLP